MNKFNRMLERMNLQSVSGFIQLGSEMEELDEKNLEERKDNAADELEQKLKEKVPASVYQDVVDTAMEFANACTDIYFIVGMKAGAKLAVQLLNDSLKDN